MKFGYMKTSFFDDLTTNQNEYSADLYNTLVRVSLDREKFPMKDIKFLINTDKKTGFESKFDPDRLFQSDLRNLPLIESKIVAETNAVIAIKGKLVLCGCDHLVRRDLHRLFEIDKDFDIAIPIRKQKKVNNAIVLVNNKSTINSRLRYITTNTTAKLDNIHL